MASCGPWLAVCHSTPTTRLSKMLHLTPPVPSLSPVLRVIFQSELSQAPPSCWNGHRVPLHQDGTVAWIFSYISVDGFFYPVEGTKHTGHKCGRSQTFPSATARSGATCETLPPESALLSLARRHCLAFPYCSQPWEGLPGSSKPPIELYF